MCSADCAEFWEDFFTERIPYELFSLCNCPTTGAVQHMVSLPYVIAFLKLDVTSSDHNQLIAVALLGRAEASRASDANRDFLYVYMPCCVVRLSVYFYSKFTNFKIVL